MFIKKKWIGNMESLFWYWRSYEEEKKKDNKTKNAQK